MSAESIFVYTGDKETDKETLVKHIAAEWILCKKNPLYYISNYVKLALPGKLADFKLYEPQKRVINEFFKNGYVIVLKSRQTGISTVVQALVSHLVIFHENCVVGVISKNAEAASDFCRKIQVMIDNLPSWLRPKYLQKNVQYFILENNSQVYSAAVSPVEPEGVFRSKSLAMLVVDEAAHIRYIDEAWTGMASTLSKTFQVARQQKIPTGVIIISTPNKVRGTGQWFFQMWKEARANANAFTPCISYWKEIPEYANDPNWYISQCKILNNDRRRIAQELELKFIGTDDALFDEVTQEKLQEKRQPAKRIDNEIIRSINKGVLQQFVDIIDPKRFYLIGVDIATPAGADYSAIEVMDYKDASQVLEFRGKADPKKIVKVLKLICSMCPNNLLLIENTGGYGQAVIYDLLYDSSGYSFNIFEEKEGKPGISTNVRTRPLMLDSLYEVVTDDPYRIKSELLALELIGLVRRGDRIEADKGLTDDLALAFAFCCYVRKYCSHLISVRELDDVELRDIKASELLHEVLISNQINPTEMTTLATIREAMVSSFSSPEEQNAEAFMELLNVSASKTELSPLESESESDDYRSLLKEIRDISGEQLF